MNRFLCYLGLAVIMLGIPASHFAFPGGPPCPKLKNREYLCHISGSEKSPKGPVKRKKGLLLYTSQVAVNHHLAHHRDCAGKNIIRLGKKACTCNNCVPKCEEEYDKCIDSCNGRQNCKGKCKKDLAKCKLDCNKI